jgi:hypothetical protein
MWARIVGKAMEAVVRIEAPPEVGVPGIFKDAIEEFLTNKQKGKRIEDIFSGRPWEDEGQHIYLFTLAAVRDFLERKPQLRGYSAAQVTQRIKDLGGGHRGIMINRKFRNLWFIPTAIFEAKPDVPPPPMDKEPL